MNNLQEQIREEVIGAMTELPEMETPREFDFNCGQCTGDIQYNDNYYTECYQAKQFIWVSNSCRSYLLENSREVNISTLNHQELKGLIDDVTDAVKAQKKENEEIEKEIEGSYL